MTALLLGLSIGLAAGLSPGPLLVLVIAATLRSGWVAGAVTAAAPLVSDLVVVAVVLLVLDHLPARTLALVGVVGGCYVVYTGVVTVRDSRTAVLEAAGTSPVSSVSQRQTLRRAVLVNVASPHPWVAWATALGPLTIATARTGIGSGVALVVGFYLALVGAKMLVAVLVARGRHRLSARGYRRTLTGAGMLLVLAGIVLVVEFLPPAVQGSAVG